MMRVINILGWKVMSSLLLPGQNLQINEYIFLIFYLMLLFVKKKENRKSIGRQKEHWMPTAERSV